MKRASAGDFDLDGIEKVVLNMHILLLSRPQSATRRLFQDQSRYLLY